DHEVREPVAVDIAGAAHDVAEPGRRGVRAGQIDPRRRRAPGPRRGRISRAEVDVRGTEAAGGRTRAEQQIGEAVAVDVARAADEEEPATRTVRVGDVDPRAGR